MDFVVFACAKSGTTWLQRMLCAHPEVHCGETRPFGRYFDPHHPSTPHLTLQTYVETLVRYHNAPGDREPYADRLLDALMDTIASTAREVSGKRVYGEKITPYPGTARAVADHLLTHYPSAAFVHLVRDGRDVAVSGAVHQARLRRDRAGGPPGGLLAANRIPRADLLYWADLWGETVRAGSHAAARFARSVTIRYEQMLDEPHGAMRSVLECVGVACSDALVERCVRAGRFERLSGGRPRGVEDRSSFFRLGIAGDWRNWLTDDDERAFLERVGDAANLAVGVKRLSA